MSLEVVVAAGGLDIVVGADEAAATPYLPAVALGDRLASMAIDANAAAGETDANFTVLSPRVAADNNSLPGDTGALLRLPTEDRRPSETGIAIRAATDGEDYWLMLPWGSSTSGTPLPLGTQGALQVVVRQPIDGERPSLRIDVATSPAHAVEVDVYAEVAAPAVGITQSNLNAVLAAQRHDESRIAALENRPAGAGGASEQQVDDKIAAALRPNVAQIVWDESARQETIIQTDAQGQRTRTVIEHSRGSDNSLTVAGVFAALAAAAPTAFSYAGNVLTYTGRKNIVLSDLSTDVVNLINGKLSLADLNTRLGSLLRSWALASGGRIPEEALDKKIDDILDAWSGDAGWKDNADGRVRRVSYTVPNPSNVGADYPAAYVSSFLEHPREENIYKAIALPTGSDVSNWRLAIGSFAYYLGSTWTRIEENDAGQDFYIVQVSDIPLGDTVSVQHFDHFTVDAVKLGFEPWTRQGGPNIPAHRIVQDENFVPGTGEGALFRANGEAPAFRKIKGGRKAAGAVAALPSDFDQATLDKWDSISAGAEVNPPPVAQDVAEAGVDPRLFSWSPLRFKQAAQALAPRAHPSTVLIDGPGVGLAIAGRGSQQSQRNAAIALFRPTPTTHFDLGDDDNQRGVFLAEAAVRLETRSDNQIGFDDNTANPVIETRIEGFAFARNLRAATAWAAGADNGRKIGGTVVRRGSTALGEIALWLGKDASNRVGYWLAWTGAAGAYTWSFALNPIEAVFLHSD